MACSSPFIFDSRLPGSALKYCLNTKLQGDETRTLWHTGMVRFYGLLPDSHPLVFDPARQ